ncbi:MAG: hypothetical protein AAGD11_11130 [Planctomycetota bacterium]
MGRTRSGRGLAGRSVAQALNQAAEQLRRHQSECQTGLRRLDESTNEWVDRRGKTLLELAEHYLPDVSRDSVLATFRGIRHDLLEVLKQKQQRERQLHDALVEDEAEANRLKSSLEEVTQQLNEKVAEREQLETVVADRLKEHEQFQQISKQALAAEQELQRNEERIAEIKQEASDKLPAYENNRLFRYLYDRGFGTSEYKKKGLTRRLDRWVAKMVKYGRSKRSYDFLRVTPELMAAEVTRRREQFNVLMEQLEGIEAEIALEVGLTAVIQAGKQLGNRRDELVGELGQLEERFDGHHHELLALEGKQNDFYDQGVQRMKKFLADMQHSWLEHQSRSTPERQDDELVAEIGWLNAKLDEARRDSGELTKELRNLDDRMSGLHEVMQRFRRADFDSRRSVFDDDFDVERQLSGYLRGEIGREELWSAMRRYQYFHQPRYQQRGWDIDDSWEMDDLGGVLGRVLIEVAGEAMKHAVRRGMQRRGPYRLNQQPSSRPQLPTPRWFTKGRGF